MLLRLIAILLLVILVLRAVARMIRGAARPSQPETIARAGQPLRKQLLQCPRCGTFFESGRGLPARAGVHTELVCSQSCAATEAEPDRE